MTVEERANEVMRKWEEVSRNVGSDRLVSGTNMAELIFVQWIIDALRDQIEECAKVADQKQQEHWKAQKEWGRKRQPVQQAMHANLSVICGRIGKEIRALAEPKPETEGKED